MAVVVDRDGAMANLQDWLNEINWIVSYFDDYADKWYDRFVEKISTYTVKTVRNRCAEKKNPFFPGIAKFCMMELMELDQIVSKINGVPTADELRRLVRRAYVMIYVNSPIDEVLESDF